MMMMTAKTAVAQCATALLAVSVHCQLLLHGLPTDGAALGLKVIQRCTASTQALQSKQQHDNRQVAAAGDSVCTVSACA
jgi:hypothetical protein